MIVYKIRHRETGYFSSGDFPPLWSEFGKCWTRIADVVAHLMLNVDDSDLPIWEVVVFVLVEKSATSAEECMAEKRTENSRERLLRMTKQDVRAVFDDCDKGHQACNICPAFGCVDNTNSIADKI